MRSHEKPNPTHIFPHAKPSWPKLHISFRLMRSHNKSSILLAFPYNFHLSLPLLFLPQFSNKQQSPFTIFQQTKKKQMHMHKPEADLQSFFHSLLFFFFFFLLVFFFFFFCEDLMLEINLGNVLWFLGTIKLVSALKTGRFDHGSKGSLKN